MLNPTEITGALQILGAWFDHGIIEWRSGQGPHWRIVAGTNICVGVTLAEALENMLQRVRGERDGKTEADGTAEGGGAPGADAG